MSTSFYVAEGKTFIVESSHKYNHHKLACFLLFFILIKVQSYSRSHAHVLVIQCMCAGEQNNTEEGGGAVTKNESRISDFIIIYYLTVQTFPGLDKNIF